MRTAVVSAALVILAGTACAVRPIEHDPAVVVSPCDAIIGACGRIAGTKLLQIKGFTYTIRELTHDGDIKTIYRNGRYVTLRLTSSMYHRFHAPLRKDEEWVGSSRARPSSCSRRTDLNSIPTCTRA